MALRKISYDVDASGADEEAAEGIGYTGPLPPKGVYRVKIKFMTGKPNKNNDLRLSGIVEIDEKGEKAKYNGYGIWYGENVTNSSAKYVNAFLDACGFSRQAVWKTKQIFRDELDETKVVKIGTKFIEDVPCRVNTRLEKDPNGDPDDDNGGKRLGLVAWLPPSDDADADEGDQWASGADDEAADAGEEEGAEEGEDLWDEESLGALTRVDLVKEARAWEIKPLKKHSDEDLIALILEAQEAAQAEEGEEGEGEDEEEPPF